MPRRSKQAILDEVHAEALERFDEAESAEHDQRDECRDDVQFAQVPGAMWKNWFDRDKNKPRFEINRIQHAINQVVGEFQRNTVGIKVRPSGGQATMQLAETYGGLIRNIFNCSNFDEVQCEVLKEVCNGGYGAWRVTTAYSDPESFNQDIGIEWVPDACNSVWFDPYDMDPLKRNARYAFVSKTKSIKAFREEYPDAAPADVTTDRNANIYRQGWLRERGVRLAEYFRKVKKMKTIVMMSDGKSVFLDEIKPYLDELAMVGIEPVKERKVEHYDIEWYKISGSEVLEGPIVLANKRFIPVIPCYGFHYWIDELFFWHGMVRHAKDAQKIYNFTTSTKLEQAARSPKDPIFVTPRQVGKFKDMYQNFNVRNSPFLFWEATENEPPPFKLGPPAVQQALIEQTQQADADIQATLGRFNMAQGQGDVGANTQVSGMAIRHMQNASNAGQEELFQNLKRSIQHTGDVLLDLIPNVYDTARQMRIVKTDGSTEFAPVNQEMVDIQTGERYMYNDLKTGKYDLEITLQPSFKTQQQEALHYIELVSQTNPQLAAVSADLIAKNLDFAEAPELEKRIRKTLIQQGVIKPNEEEAAEMQADAEAAAQQPPDPMQVLQMENFKRQSELLAAEVDKREAEILETQARTEKLLGDKEKSQADVIKTITDAMATEMEAGTRRTEALMSAKIDQINALRDTIKDDMNNTLEGLFKNVNPGLYQDEQGNVVQVDEAGQIGPMPGLQ